MCLLAMAHAAHPRYRLVIAINRDEEYSRPTDPAHFWEGRSQILAGLDRKGGGTWFGVTRTGRFAAVTNYRDPRLHREGMKSRGDLTRGFLESVSDSETYLREQVIPERVRYNPFNLLIGSPGEIRFYSSVENQLTAIGAGVFGLSNASLDTLWPKVERSKRALSETLSLVPESGEDEFPFERIFDFLQDRTPASDAALPNTGVGLKLERFLSPAFIESDSYGTRSSAIYWIDAVKAETSFIERTYRPGKLPETRKFQFPLVSFTGSDSP